MKSLVTFAKLCTLFLCLVLSACMVRPYKFDITQGNPLTTEQINEVHPGMSADQVRYALGTPMLQDVFHTNRWDYVYYDKPGYKPPKRNHVAIYFENGQVVNITTDDLPEAVA